MKILKWFVAIVVVVLGVVLVSLIFWGGHVIKHGVNVVGPRVLGVPVRLERARFYPLRGHVSLSGMTVGNPEGFHTESLFDLRHLEVDLNVRSLFTDTIIIDRILIEAPQITVEAGLRRTNLGALLAQLESATDPDAPEEGDVGKTVVIKELILADGRAQVSATAMRGRVVPVQLSAITLNDLGGEDQSLTQIVTEVVKAVVGAVGNAVAGAGDLLGEGLQSALQGAGALTERAADGARAVTGTAGEGARAVTGAVAEGARRARGLLGGENGEESDKPEAEHDDPAGKIEDQLKDGASRIGDALGGLRTRKKEE